MRSVVLNTNVYKLKQSRLKMVRYGHVRGIFGLRFIKAVQPPVVTVYRLPVATLARDGWAALQGAERFAGDHTD